MFKILLIIGILFLTGCRQQIGADDALTKREKIKDNLIEWYYQLPKVIPDSNGQKINDGYDGPVVRRYQNKDIKPADIYQMFEAEAKKQGVDKKPAGEADIKHQLNKL